MAAITGITRRSGGFDLVSEHRASSSPIKQSGWWYTYPSEKSWSSSLGMMTFPTEWKNEIHVPNHQSDNIVKTSILKCH